MKIWVDDTRTHPFGYMPCKSTNETIRTILNFEKFYSMSGGKSIYKIEEINLDHDAGKYAKDGGDYIKILDWLEETDRNYPIVIHSRDSVGIENMKMIAEKNNWQYKIV